MASYCIQIEFDSPPTQQPVSVGPLTRTTNQWSNINTRHRHGNSVTIPRSMFALNKRVKDQIAGEWQGGNFHPKKTLIDDNSRPTRECIVVVLESPHFHEYRFVSNGNWEPLAPLNNPESRAKFEHHIGRLVEKAVANSQSQAAIDIVLCNPVPLQASLAQLMKASDQESVQGLVRNCVWTVLYQGGYEQNFLERLDSYNPRAVINACTSNLKKKVGKTLTPWALDSGTKSVALWNCTEHPSFWNKSTDISPAKRARKATRKARTKP